MAFVASDSFAQRQLVCLSLFCSLVVSSLVRCRQTGVNYTAQKDSFNYSHRNQLFKRGGPFTSEKINKKKRCRKNGLPELTSPHVQNKYCVAASHRWRDLSLTHWPISLNFVVLVTLHFSLLSRAQNSLFIQSFHLHTRITHSHSLTNLVQSERREREEKEIRFDRRAPVDRSTPHNICQMHTSRSTGTV